MAPPVPKAAPLLSGEHPAIVALRNAPIDDEPETEEERAAVEEAKEDVRQGRVVSHPAVRASWLAKP